MRPYIAIIAAFLLIFSVALRQAQNHGTRSSTLTIASGSSIGSSQASSLSLPQPKVRAASAVSSKACSPKNSGPNSSDRAANEPTRKLSERTLKTPADYQGNQKAFVLAEYGNSLQLIYRGRDSQSVGEFLELGNQKFNAAIDGLRGCTAVFVASRAGMWLAHFWEAPAFRHDAPGPGGWNVELDEPMPRTESNRVIFREQVLLQMQQGGPHIPGLRQYINPGGPFHRSQRVEYAIITPRLWGSNRGSYEYEPEVREISAVMNDLFPGAHSVIVDYEREAGIDSQEDTVAGKMLFQYDPWEAGPCDFGQVALYKVWFEDQRDPILNDQWLASQQQIIKRREDYHPSYRRAKVNACGSSKPHPPATPTPQQTTPEIL